MAPTKVLEEIEDNINCKLPDIVYVDNLLLMKHKPTGFSFYFNAVDGLKFINFETREKLAGKYDEAGVTKELNAIDYIPENIQVSISKHWKNKQMPEDVEIDTTYKVESD